MSARNGTSEIIWLAIVLIAVSIATSAMGLFMDSWRYIDEDEAVKDDEMAEGLSGSQGLNNLVVEYDLTKFMDGLLAGECSKELIKDMDSTDAECLDDDTILATFEISEMCDTAEDVLKDAKDAGMENDELDEYEEDVEDTCATADAGTTGSIILWFGFGSAIISMLLCVITAFSGDSGSRNAGSFGSLGAGLLMLGATLLWVVILPNGINGDSEDADLWVAGLNFYLTIVGGFLAVVAGIIALFAGGKGGQSFAAPMQAMPQQQFHQQQQQQQQFYQQQQQQQYEQPKQYKQ